MSSGGAWVLIIIAAVVATAWYFHTPGGQQGPSDKERQMQFNACEDKAKKVADFRFKKTAHINYINAHDADNNLIGWFILTEESYDRRSGTVTLSGPEYTRLPDTSGRHLKVVPLDKSRDMSFLSARELLLALCKVDPVNGFMRGKDPKAITRALVNTFGKK